MSRSSASIFTGITRSDVAVGTVRLASIFSAILAATPLIWVAFGFGSDGAEAADASFLVSVCCLGVGFSVTGVAVVASFVEVVDPFVVEDAVDADPLSEC